MFDDVAKEIADIVKEAVQQGFSELSKQYEGRIKALEDKPHPEKGDKGEDGKDGKDGKDGENGKDGIDGKDGVSPTAEDVAKAMEGSFHKWALDFERKADDILRKSVERIEKPKDGKDGRDALEVKDFNIEILEDGRTVKFSLDNGTDKVEKTVRLPTVIDRGVYTDAKSYEAGDGVTYGGSFWIAQKDAPEGKPMQGSDWRLAVKRGRDGRESVKVERGLDKVKVS